MIVFDLKCAANGHVFEAWFASTAAFEDQRDRALIACPLCGQSDVDKAVMAPRISAKSNMRGETLPVASAAPAEDAERKALIAAMAEVQAKLIAKSEWVGREFDAKARAMDAGEVDRATIHGQVTREEAAALVEDGIAVMPLLFPVVPPEQRN